jgi:hypothetical protein
MAALILERPSPKILHGGFWLQRPYTAPLRSEPLPEFPTQLLHLSIPTIDMSASSGVLGLSRKQLAHHIGAP